MIKDVIVYICTFIENQDFNGEDIVITFEPDDTSKNPQREITSNISITDDTINEASELFILKMTLEDAVNLRGVLLKKNSVTLCRITDNDCEYLKLLISSVHCVIQH